VMANNGARFLDWLQDKGAQFVRFNELEGYRWCMAPPRSLRAGIDWQGRGPDVVLQSLVERFVELGGDIRRGTHAQSLLMQAERCCGVHVIANGRPETICGDHVLIADGGFQANQELYRQHISENFNRVFQRGARTGMGDGLKMAVDAGASLRGMDRFYGHVLCRDALHNDNVWPYPEIDAIATSGMVVNATGQRLVDEGVSGVFLTNELARASADDGSNDVLYAIFDAAIWQEPGRSARIPVNPLLESAGGTVLRADTIAELAALAGLPSEGLVATIDEYNAALASGTLDQLSIPRSCALQPWPIIEAPFMAIPVCPGITYTMGGIAIDEHAQVLNEAGQPIAGLFAAGAATGGLEGGRHAAYIGGLMKAGVFGLIAAERVAALEGLSTGSTTLRDGSSTSQPGSSASGAPRQPSAHVPASAPQPAAVVRPSRLATYPMLNAVLRYGKVASIALSLIIAALVLYLAWQDLGTLAVALALLAGLVTGALALTFTELVRLITDMLLPS
jgi:fumarate reductase flavoprotein subunit